MLPEVLGLLPQRVLSCSLGAALTMAVVGAGLWLAGARFSRSLITLIAVGIGTTLGLHLPGWMGWHIDGMALAVGGALVLGSSGYLLHRTWVGLWLGTILSIWAGVAVWIAMAGSGQWAWSVQATRTEISLILARHWEQLPGTINPAMPLALACGFATGVLISVVWPILARVITWSLAGMSLLVGMGGVALQTSRPHWLSAIPGTATAQVAGLLLLAALGAVVQWSLMPKASNPMHKEVNEGLNKGIA